MNDKELLEYAAKAAGHDIEVIDNKIWINGDYLSPHDTRPWNPLDNDSEAFKLLNDLSINIEFTSCLDDSPLVVCKTYMGGSVELPHFPDSAKQLRRCIVMAAVIHGDEMS